MDIKSRLIKELSEIDNPKEKLDFIKGVMTFVNEINSKALEESFAENIKIKKLEKKIELSKSLIEDAKNEVEKSEKTAIVDIKKKLQPTRDRIMAISSTADFLSNQIKVPKAQVNIINDTINNLHSNVNVIHEELNKLNLWDEDDLRPKKISHKESSERTEPKLKK